MTQQQLFQSENSLRPLRPYQADAMEAIKQAIREGHKRIVLYLATGGGKTLISAHIISGALSKGKRAVFTCPSIALVNQTVKALKAEGIEDIGVMQAQHELTDFRAAVQVASVQTLIRRAIPEVDIILNDEGHEVFDKLNERLDSNAWKDKIAILLSATPGTRGLGLRWTKLTKVVTIQELVEQGYLVPSLIYAPHHEPDLSGVKTVKGEYEVGGLSAVMRDDKIVGDAVKEWKDKAFGLRTFMFCVDLAHAQKMREEFLKSGISCGYIDGSSTDDERRETFERYRNGLDNIIASVGCLIRGIDEDVRCIIDLQPVKSRMRHVQKIGRGKRPAPGKSAILILDHADNNYRLGEVEHIHFDTLDCRKPGDKSPDANDEKPVPKPRKCHNCRALLGSGVRNCPACGNVWTRPNTTEHHEGDLVMKGYDAKVQADFDLVRQFLEAKGMTYCVEFGWHNGYDIAVKHGYKGPRPEIKEPKPPKAQRNEKQDFYSGLLYMAQMRGFKDGWVSHKYRTRFGVWPVGLEKIPRRPIKAVRQFDAEQSRLYREQQKQAKQQQDATLEKVEALEMSL
jgi:DNA repair protein RadD